MQLYLVSEIYSRLLLEVQLPLVRTVPSMFFLLEVKAAKPSFKFLKNDVVLKYGAFENLLFNLEGEHFLWLSEQFNVISLAFNHVVLISEKRVKVVQNI